MAKSLKQSSSFEAHLSRDLVFKILERLSLKSMLQMKSVCTLWRDVVSDPSFIKAHLHKSYSLRRIRYINGAPIMKSVGLDDQETWYEHSIPTTEFSRPPPYDASVYDVTRAHVYNCKTDSWKKIEHFPYIIFEDAQGVTMNGYPHWIVFRDHFGQDKVVELVIVYFDLVEEKFKEIPKPSWLVESSSFSFGVYEGKLCFIHYTTVIQREIWVMEKHGESWINVSSVLDIKSVILPGWSSGHPYGNFSFEKPFVGAQYVESLVSPYGGNDMVG